MPDKKLKKPKGSGAKKIVPLIPDPSSRASMLPKAAKVADWRLADFGSPEKLDLNPIHKGSAPSLHGYHCTRAWTVRNNQEKVARFNEASRRIGNVVTLYHGTPSTNIANIILEGLRPGRSGMFGAGIYMGEPAKASGYTGGSSRRYMFEVRAALGKSKEMSQADYSVTLGGLLAEGFHSVAGHRGVTITYGSGTLRNSEWVVYSPDQVLAVRIYEFQYVTPMTEDTGGCRILRKKNVPLDPGMSAFADILTEKPCGLKPTMPIDIEVLTKNQNDKTVEVCAECIKRLRLKKGDRVKVLLSYGWGRNLRQVEVRVKG